MISTIDQKWEKFRKRADQRVYNLGIAVEKEPKVLNEIPQDIFTVQSVYITEFGKGLASQV